MKRRANRNKQALAVQKPAPEKTCSQAVATMETETREQKIAAIEKFMRKITGTRTFEAANRFIAQIDSALVWPKPTDDKDRLLRASALMIMAEISPQNAIQAMLATQMIAVNDAALLFLSQATLQGQFVNAADACVLRATRLMRIFNEQLEAMQRLKGKACQQKVTVEHVHVHDGGQAIVGAVTTAGPEPGRGAGG
jgi:hypothetical protein